MSLVSCPKAVLSALFLVAACDSAAPLPSDGRDLGVGAIDGSPPVVDASAGDRPPVVGPARGFADVHVHQMAEYAYAGAWIWGSSVGEESVALAACSGGAVSGGDHARTTYGVLNEFLGETTGSAGDTGLHKGKKLGFPSYTGWPRWDTIAHQQVWEGHLRAAHARGLNLMIMAAVNFAPLCEAMPEANRKPGLTCNDMESVDRQLDAAWEFDRARDWVEIALSPDDARRIIGEGKLAIILAIEVSDLFPVGDWRAQLDAYHGRGVRAMQLVHQLDNRFAGAAPHHWIFKVFQILNRGAGFDLDAGGRNRKGLTDDGRGLAAALMERGMIVDISHLSERAVADIHAVSVAHSHYPLVLSHGHFRSILMPGKQDEEKTTPDEIVRLIRETGGMFGLRTGAEQVRTYTRSGVANDCDGSTKSLAQAYSYGSKGLKVDIALASDFNGFIQQLRPRFGADSQACGASGDDARRARQQAAQRDPTGTPLDTSGFGHIGLEPEVIDDLRGMGVDVSGLMESAERFIRVWERGLDPTRQGPLPTDDMDTSGIAP